MARFRVPANNREVLAVPSFDAVTDIVEENRRKLDRSDVQIGEYTLEAIRRWTKVEIFRQDDDQFGKVIVTGHEPELSHPGVWLKNFALDGLANKLGALRVNLIVDTATRKSASLRIPTFRDHDPASVRVESVPFDRFAGEVPYEDRGIIDSDVFAEFLPKARELIRNWGYRPLLLDAWQYIDPGDRFPIGEQFARVRRRYERTWGCNGNDVKVSELSQTPPFREFASHILRDLDRFREVYNAAILAYRKANHIRSDNHPAPELAKGEAPFWVRTAGGRRERATATSDVRAFRPRALTLTLFARVCLGDFFIHGIGGGKYDDVTDAIVRDYFGIEPPAYQVLSATLHLPLPAFPSSSDDLRDAEQRVRDQHWNPQRHLPAGVARELVEWKARLIAAEPRGEEHAARREWFRELQKLTAELRPFVAKVESAAQVGLERVRAEVAANEILQRRDYAWVLYPEETLRPFLQQFLHL